MISSAVVSFAAHGVPSRGTTEKPNFSYHFSHQMEHSLSTGNWPSSQENCSSHSGICTCLKHFISFYDKISQNIKKGSRSNKSCWHSTGYLFWTGWLTKEPAVTTYERTQNNEVFRKNLKGLKKDTLKEMRMMWNLIWLIGDS